MPIKIVYFSSINRFSNFKIGIVIHGDLQGKHERAILEFLLYYMISALQTKGTWLAAADTVREESATEIHTRITAGFVFEKC